MQDLFHLALLGGFLLLCLRLGKFLDKVTR
jgi:hypothetical protein